MSKTAIQQNGWREVNLGEVCSDISYGYTASAKNDPVGPRFLRITDIVPDRINWKDVPYCNIDNKNAKKYKLHMGDIVIARTGATTGYNKTIKSKVNAVFASYLIRYRINPSTAYAFYVGHALQSPYWKNFVGSVAGGSAQPGANAKQFASFVFNLPPLSEQKAIAGVLSSLDDKIDLLYRQNKTLEDMAQALFRKWFVEEADEGWNQKKLGDFFPIITGKKDANYSTYNGRYLFFTCAQGILRAPDYSFEGKAILLAGNGDFNVKRYEGKFEAYQRTYVLIPYEEKYFGFLYILIKFYLDQITGGAQGSVIRFITKGMISDFTFLLPNTNIDDKLEQMNQIYLKVDSNRFQIYTLENLRNTLLPKLMSGAARVRFDL